MLMSDAPSRLNVFEAVDGKSTAEEIARKVGRPVNNVTRDLATLRDAGLIQERGKSGRATIYEKIPLAKTVSTKYFQPVAKLPKRPSDKNARGTARRVRVAAGFGTPSEQEILEIARTGEDQHYEFKAQGTDPSKIAREIAALANTAEGGLVIYGIDDAGNIEGSDVSRQKLDQPLQNSIKNTISPALTVKLASVNVMGSEVIVIIVPPWNRRDVYQYNERILIRKGTNVFAAKPEEVKSLHAGKAVV